MRLADVDTCERNSLARIVAKLHVLQLVVRLEDFLSGKCKRYHCLCKPRGHAHVTRKCHCSGPQPNVCIARRTGIAALTDGADPMANVQPITRDTKEQVCEGSQLCCQYFECCHFLVRFDVKLPLAALLATPSGTARQFSEWERKDGSSELDS